MIWIFVIVVVIAYGHPFISHCWDGLDVNEEQLMQDCNVTFEQYWEEVQSNADFCPDAWESLTPVGECVTDWRIAVLYLVVASAIYNAIYAGVYLLRRKK